MKPDRQPQPKAEICDVFLNDTLTFWLKAKKQAISHFIIMLGNFKTGSKSGYKSIKVLNKYEVFHNLMLFSVVNEWNTLFLCVSSTLNLLCDSKLVFHF